MSELGTVNKYSTLMIIGITVVVSALIFGFVFWLTRPGSKPKTNCPKDCNDNGGCLEGKCVCYKGWSGVDCGIKN